MNLITRKVYDYICNQFGSRILSSQQEFPPETCNPDEGNLRTLRITGKLPAIRGLDFMNSDFSGVVERATEWWKIGGIVTICWHTGVYSGSHYESLDDSPDFTKLLKAGSVEQAKMLENWDAAAEALKSLQSRGVPVLWKPFHEPDGEWFWWGKGGADVFKRLWKMMYERFSIMHGLDNLIWVLGYTTEVKDRWYPGDEYCDIIGSDTYNGQDPNNAIGWAGLNRVSTSLPRCYHESEAVPTDEEIETGNRWSYIHIWHSHIFDLIDPKDLYRFYNNECVITLEDLPDWKEG